MPRSPIYWLTTDTHFYHDAIMKPEFCGRPANYIELIMKNLRYVVAEQDFLIHLGDVIFYKQELLKGMLDSIPCAAKFLVMGNHDRKSRNWYAKNGFHGAFQSLQFGDILLSHRPQKSFPDGVRINVHGHFHNTDHRNKEPEYNDWYDTSRHRLLALEYTNYEPVKLVDFAA